MGIGWMPWVEKPGLTRSLTLALLALLPGACSHQPAKPLQDEYIGIGNGRLVYRDQQIHLVDGQWINNFDRTPVIGSGPYRYRFVLHDSPQGKPAPLRPFALSNRRHHLPFVSDAKQVFRGMTDAEGFTPVFAFTQPIEEDSWLLRERFGDGPHGEQFRFSHTDGKRRFGIPYVHYKIVVCEPVARLHRGISDGNGHTGYVASASPIQAFLFQLGDEEAEAKPTEQDDNLQAARLCKEQLFGK